MAEASFLGGGLAFPVQADARGALLVRSGAEKIEESIRLVLGTRPGERPMRPDFGCDAHELVFAAAASPRTIGAVSRAVQDALARWEPRIDVLSVVATPLAGGHAGGLVVEVQYAIRATNQRRNLVHPFYAISPESESDPAGPDHPEGQP